MTDGPWRLLAVTTENQLSDWVHAWIPNVEVTVCADGKAAAETLAAGGAFHVFLAETRLLEGRIPPPFLEGYPDLIRVFLLPAEDLEKNLELVAEGRVFSLIGLPVRRFDVLQAVQHALAWHRLRGERPTGTQAIPAGAVREPAAVAENLFQRDLVMMAAHDIRSPLSVIVGYAGILGESEPGLTARGQEIAGRILATGTRLLEMVDHILTATSLEQGHQVLEVAPTRLTEIIEVVTETLEGMAEEKEIELVTEVEGAGQPVNLDRYKVVQVLQNLVSNALKFGPSRARVVVKVEVEGGVPTFSVADSGPGLTPEQAAGAFEKFSRFSSSAGQGIGLGLSIAKGLVELHGGRIWVESAPEKGSTFFFTIQPGGPEK